MSQCFEVAVTDEYGRETDQFIGYDPVREVFQISRNAHCFDSRSSAQRAINVFTRNPHCDHLNFYIQDIEPDEAELEALAV